MGRNLTLLLGAAVMLMTAELANGDPLLPIPPNRGSLIPWSYSPYANGIRTSTAVTFRSPLTSISTQTTVSAPDRGTVLVGGYNTMRDGRNEFGAPGFGRPLRNVGYGRTISGSTISVRARVIILAEEEERQTGPRSR
jgi:hypothetical protein